VRVNGLAAFVVLVSAVTLVVAGGAGATRGVQLRFATVTHGDSQPTLSGEVFGRPYWSVVADTVSVALLGWENALSKEDEAKIQNVEFQTHFAIGVVIPEPTSGYTVTIRRITVQRITKSKRQFCIVADLKKPPPGTAVEQRGFYAQHVVQLSSRRFRVDEFHWAIPKAWVLRESRGALLGVSTVGSAAAHDLHRSGKPGVCHA
jgi:hypothetical protein